MQSPAPGGGSCRSARRAGLGCCAGCGGAIALVRESLTAFCHADRFLMALCQTRAALRDIPPEPLVAGLPADPVLTAQHRHLILARQNPSDKLQSLVHVTGRFPRHRQVPPAGSSNLSPIHPVNSVTNLLGPYTPFA